MTITESFKRLASKMLGKPVDQVEGETISEVIDYTADNYVSGSGCSGGVAYDDTQVKSDITNLQNTKVDKVDGKGLSTNDFTDELKAKVESSPDGGGTVETIPGYGYAQIVVNGRVYVTTADVYCYVYDNHYGTTWNSSTRYPFNIEKIFIPIEITEIQQGAFETRTSLTDVYYEGSEAEWNAIDLRAQNDPLKNATKHFNWDRNTPIPVD